MAPEDLGTDKGQQIIEIWAKSVETQMHFNEMQVKSRQLGLTFVTAALGVGIVLLSEGDDFSFSFSVFGYDLTLHVSVLLTAGAMLALQAVKTLDLNVYHRMLRGAVTFGEDFERNCLVPMVGLRKGMTCSISHFSRFTDASAQEDETGKNHYGGNIKVSAHDKIRSFYRATQGFLALAAVALLIFTNSSSFGSVSDTKKLDASTPSTPSTIEPTSSTAGATDLNRQVENSDATAPTPSESPTDKATSGSN
ncbi:hypothetical protein ACNQ62_05405 [Sulfitobacter sp. SBS6]|uniref:hypothetical protein n=1 Tax=Sulfitobacter sp. SBS6 TaxID=3401755 RepID=UPI003AB0C58A